MYIPPAFREEDLPSLQAMMAAAGLATLVTRTEEGLMATPLPLVLAPEEGPYGTLYGHLARANAQARLAPQGEALVLFQGPDAYVSPGWYASKQEHHKVVPTWNYTAVHAHGPAEFFEDAERLLAVVTRLTARHEAGRPLPWSVQDAPDSFIRAQLRGITGLRLPIARLEGKVKMSQNRSAADRAGVAAGLATSARPGDRAVAALIPLDS
ncbi:FMN-binding negative transcriptional regulator [Roseomonas sp. GC11]|uniref:FMN-binding negative transcriptional regulator n=1 Tax=Roseomonas sp. GC11 TaxID=2950546 RepID=UPI00210D3D27|nr:FMN-binding negative transcriptional regulator [Roseomonas sp. GC11]MCQ4162387.1 FMN-binding negative transcriptional regulator [Roseomonas sp. GC11]